MYLKKEYSSYNYNYIERAKREATCNHNLMV